MNSVHQAAIFIIINGSNLQFLIRFHSNILWPPTSLYAHAIVGTWSVSDNNGVVRFLYATGDGCV
jgi:hypothetical protein